MLLCGCSRFPFHLATCIYYLLIISGLFTLALVGRAVSILPFFFGVAQAFKRRFCSGIYMLHFGVSASNYAPFLGSNILQRGDYAHHEICYFVVVHASPFPLQPVFIIYFSFPAYLLWPLLVGQYPFFSSFFFCFHFWHSTGV